MIQEKEVTTKLSVTRCTDPNAWNSFVERNDGPVYALWGWGDAVGQYGHEQYNLVVRAGDSIVGALPLTYMRSRLFGSKLVSPPYAARGSMILSETRPETASKLLLEGTKRLADELGVDFVSLRGTKLRNQQATERNGHHGGDTTGLHGFEKKNRFVTFRIPVDGGVDATWDNVKSSRQRQIDQARDHSLEYVEGNSIQDLKEYYRLNLESMRGHGSPPHSFEFYRVLWDRLFHTGNLQLGLVKLDGELINGILNLAAGSTVYQWGVITDYEYRDLNGGSLALWKSLEWAAKNGYDAYELGRTREGSGVYMFKKSFGGDKTWYDDLHYFPSGSENLPHPDDEKYDTAKEIWQKLPIPVTQVIGPHLRKDVSL